MKRTILLLCIGCLAISCFSFFHDRDHDNDPVITASKASLKTLIIDPGHGGFDPGAIGTMSTEAAVALQVSLKFGKAVQAEFPDVDIVYTRTTDVMAGNKRTKKEGLEYRADLANEKNGDLFIAIHCNATGVKAGGWNQRIITGRTAYKKTVGKGKKKKTVTAYKNTYGTVWVENKAQGTETYIWALSKNDAKVNSVNKTEFYGEIDSTSVGLQLPDPSDPAEKARLLIYAQHYFRKSLSLASLVEKEFTESGRISRGVKQRNDEGIWVLQATGMPSILVELGFISNKEEEEYLNSDTGQDEIVKDLLNAFRVYKKTFESKQVITGNGN